MSGDKILWTINTDQISDKETWKLIACATTHKIVMCREGDTGLLEFDNHLKKL